MLVEVGDPVKLFSKVEHSWNLFNDTQPRGLAHRCSGSKKKVCNVDSGLPADILELLRSGIGDARDDGKRTRICSQQGVVTLSKASAIVVYIHLTVRTQTSRVQRHGSLMS